MRFQCVSSRDLRYWYSAGCAFAAVGIPLREYLEKPEVKNPPRIQEVGSTHLYFAKLSTVLLPLPILRKGNDWSSVSWLKLFIHCAFLQAADCIIHYAVTSGHYMQICNEIDGPFNFRFDWTLVLSCSTVCNKTVDEAYAFQLCIWSGQNLQVLRGDKGQAKGWNICLLLGRQYWKNLG